jgi:hypothetical protein
MVIFVSCAGRCWEVLGVKIKNQITLEANDIEDKAIAVTSAQKEVKKR